MQVEYVAGICFTSGRTAQQQRHGAVCNRVLGQIIVNDEDVFLLVHEILGDGYAGIRSQELHGSGISCRSGNNDRIGVGAALFKGLGQTGNTARLLANCYINTDYAGILLVQDGIDRNSGFTGTAVADDQLALSASDRNQGVNCLNTGLQRNVYGFTVSNTVSRGFNTAGLAGANFTLSVYGLAQCVNDTAQHGFAYRNFHDAAGTAYYIALLDHLVITHQNDTDLIRAKVLYHAGYAVRQFYQLGSHSAAHARYRSDAVAYLLNNTEFFQVNIGFVGLNLGSQGFSDTLGSGKALPRHIYLA